MARYDTYKPFVLGNQFVPLVEAEAVLDTGSEIGYRFIATEEITGLPGASWLWVVTRNPPPGIPDRSEMVCRLYRGDPLEPCTPIQRLMIPCTAGSGGAIGGGAANRQTAVANPSDPTYVRLTGGAQTARFWFGTNAATVAAAFDVWNVDIVDVSVVYAVSGPFATAVENTMSLGLERQVGPVKRYMDNLVTGPDAASSSAAVRRSRLGELCPFWDSGTDPNSEPMRGPWVYQGTDDIGLYALSGAGTDDVAVFFETGAAASGDFDIQYVGLQISYRENFHLMGVGGMDLSGGVEIAEGLYAYRCPMMPASNPWAYTGGGGMSTVLLSQGESYTITVSRAYSGSVSVSSPAPIPLSLINTVWPYIPNLVGVQITKPTAAGAVPAYTETTTYPAIVMFDVVYPDDWATDMIPANVNPACHAYERQMLQSVHEAGYFYVEQEIPNDTPGTFAWAIFYARASQSVTGGLYLSQTDGAGTDLGPEGHISYDDWLALPEIVDGWRKVTVALTPPATLTGAGGVTHWQFWTTSAELLIWDILGATANHTVTAAGASSGAVSGYHAETAVADFQGADNHPLDMTIMIAQEMTGVANSATTYYRSNGSVSHANNASVTPGMPTGWAVDDLLIITAAIRVVTGAPVCPAGWTTLVDAGNLAVFSRIAQAGDVAPTITFTGGIANASCSARMIAVVGAYPDVLASASQPNAAAQDIDVPALVVNSNGPALMLWAGWKADDVTSTTGGPGSLAFGSYTTLGDDQYITLRYSMESAGVTTVAADTITVAGGTPQVSCGVTLALRTDPAFTVTQSTQSLVAVDEFCDVPVACVPTGIVYIHLAWDQVLTEMVSGWGYYEIQRRDTTMDLDVWETIAKITNPYVGEFDDYEARIGVASSWRIRTVHTTGIEGPWSATLTSTIAAPGVTGTGCSTGLLVFTSTEDPSANLAYVHVHSGDDAESFDFLESEQGSLEPMFRRDYQVALRPSERGGVSFTRTVLVNKVGIPAGTLDRGFTSLRDLAWDAVPYVCIRDELSNRWLTNINVPAGSIRRRDQGATYYQVAQIVITEVTQTPQATDVATPYLGLTTSRHVGRIAEIGSCAPLATVEDVDIRIKCIVTGINWRFYINRFDLGPPESWWGCSVSSTDGVITVFETLGDDGFFYEETTAIQPVKNQPIWIRWVFDHDDGVGTSTCNYYSSLNGTTWTLQDTAVAGPAGLVPSANPVFEIYAYDEVIIQEVIVIDTATATTIMSPDFAAQTADTSTFVDAQANTWTIREL